MQPSSALSSLPRIRKTVGIDLGTTNSVIALLDATDSALITGQDEHGRCTFPSLVGYHPEHNRLVAGRAAQALRSAPPSPPIPLPLSTGGEGGKSLPPVLQGGEGGKNLPPGGEGSKKSPSPPYSGERGWGEGAGAPLNLPLASVKRFMGLPRTFPLGPQELTPPEASACILRLLRDMLARTLNDPRRLIDSAIITMPAYFNHNQIEATRQAGELAGFEVVELLHEPTAAAIYYSWVERHGDATYLVYDLGGGTFDVSIIRRRLDDCEVLSVSGDPFLGGDDFDRLLATHLVERGAWSVNREEGQTPIPAETIPRYFDLSTPTGTINFARLVGVAERIKIELADAERVERYLPDLIQEESGRGITLEARVERDEFHRLIRDKVDRTIDCCREALSRARERAGLRLADIDYIILVGGSSRVPLVRETVRAAFCNPDLPEQVRSLTPLLHEPDLCVAYGAALRAATHGTRYLFADVELHLTSPVNTREIGYHAAGIVSMKSAAGLDGGSVRIRSLATGLVEEAFLDERGTFAQDLELEPETDNALEFAVCDGLGIELARVVICVRHQGNAPQLGQAVLPTQLITKPLQIEVLSRGGQRIKQVVAPVGATLPGVFRCTCRTHDQSGRIVVPIFEENRVVKQMAIEDLDPALPIGSPVEVEFAIDVKHTIEVRVRVLFAAPDASKGDPYERCETATLSAPPAPRRPTRIEIDEIQKQIEDLLPEFSGSFRTRLRTKAQQIRQDLFEALRYDDEPKAIQRMAELRELLQQLESRQGQVLDPPWPRFAQLVQHCLSLAAEVADKTGRERDELAEHIHAQERYAEQAFEEHNQPLYRECTDNLEKYAGYLHQLLNDALPRPPRSSRSPEEEARARLDQFRTYLSTVWKQVRERQRADLEARLTEIAGQARGLTQRIKTDPMAVLHDTNRLGTEVEKVADLLLNRRATPNGNAGLLEGPS